MTEQLSRSAPKVFISSTCEDLKRYREAARDAVLRAECFPMMFEYWESKATPPLSECMYRVRQADLLLVIVAYRFGWVPPDQSEPNSDIRKSITWLECDEAIKNGKQVIPFLVNENVSWPIESKDEYRMIDALRKGIATPELLADVQWRIVRLAAFKSELGKSCRRTFDSPDTLGYEVFAAVEGWMKSAGVAVGTVASPVLSTHGLASSHEGEDRAGNLDSAILEYGKKAEALHAHLPVAGFATKLTMPIDVDDIYIPLRAVVDLRGIADNRFLDGKHAKECLREDPRDREIALPDALGECERLKRRGVVILGDPGSGKTTHLKRLLLCCLRKGPETIGLPKGAVPVFLPLRELDAVDLKHGVDDFIQKQLDRPHLATPEGFGKRLLARGNLLLLFDGLDEVADLHRREEVSRWIDDACRLHGTCRFVVTCRYAGYNETVALKAPFLELHIQDLTEEQAGQFVRKWYRIVETGLSTDSAQAELIAEEKAEKLIAELKKPGFRAARVFELTRNPLLLANLCLVHQFRGTLPKKRARLYEECIDVLLQHWREGKGLGVGTDAQTGRSILQPAALWLHGKEGRILATADELTPVLEPALKAAKWTEGTARDFLMRVRDESGLLTGWDREHYGFMHLGFQEYLAAREIRTLAFEDKDGGILRELTGHFGESWWQEVVLLLLALEDPSLFVPYMREVVKRQAFLKYPALVDACVEDAAKTSPQPFVELIEMPPGKDRDLWERQQAALRVLERLAPDAIERLAPVLDRHPSKAIRRWSATRRGQKAQSSMVLTACGDYELVRIAGGVFMMGSPKGEEDRHDDEKLHEVRVRDFWIGRYAVTNEQYGLFMKANPDVKAPERWGDRQFNQARQPVVGVNWHEATKFAEWAGARLPTEAEWEYACRAGTNTRFYTGNKDEDLDRAGWYGGNSGGKTHPVGEKEPNAFGLYDMHGNVYEWCQDWYGGYPAGSVTDPTGPSSGSRRVLRGGSWRGYPVGCRSAIRGSHPPESGVDIFGFRCCCALRA